MVGRSEYAKGTRWCRCPFQHGGGISAVRAEGVLGGLLGCCEEGLEHWSKATPRIDGEGDEDHFVAYEVANDVITFGQSRYSVHSLLLSIVYLLQFLHIRTRLYVDSTADSFVTLSQQLTTMADTTVIAPNNTIPALPSLLGVAPLVHAPRAGDGQI